MRNISSISQLDLRKLLDITVFAAVFSIAYALHDGDFHRPLATMLAWVAFKFIFVWMSGSYERFWRYTSLNDLRNTLSYIIITDLAAIPLLMMSGFSLLEAVALSAMALWCITLARV